MVLGLEDIGRVTLPGWIYGHFKIKLDSLEKSSSSSTESLLKSTCMVKDLLTMKVAILVESKSRFHENDVKKFYDEVFSKVKKML